MINFINSIIISEIVKAMDGKCTDTVKSTMKQNKTLNSAGSWVVWQWVN